MTYEMSLEEKKKRLEALAAKGWLLPIYLKPKEIREPEELPIGEKAKKVFGSGR